MHFFPILAHVQSSSLAGDVRFTSATNTALQLLRTASTSSVSAETAVKSVQAVRELYASRTLTSLVPLLPLLLRLRGKPMHLQKHFYMEPLFSTQIPERMVYKTGRQVAKTTSLAAMHVLLSTIPYLSQLYVTPFFVQTTRFSSLFVRPLLQQSPLGRLLYPDREKIPGGAVLQMAFPNNAVQHFSFAFLDCERIRGIPADLLTFDEVQNIDKTFLPVIESVLDGSENFGCVKYFGTPLTEDNTLHVLFERSSQAEWVTPCTACNRDNIAGLKHHLLQMIQTHGVSCHHCGRLIDPSTGHWQHGVPSRTLTFPGRHVPQVIVPRHYANPSKWRQLVLAKEGGMAWPQFLNEKLGEACDVLASELTRSDLRAAATLPFGNSEAEALKQVKKYNAITLGIDWGGGGAESLSYTAMAVLGHRPDRSLDVLYMLKLLRPYTDVEQAQIAYHLARKFAVARTGHDFGGSGGLRDTLLIQAGMPVEYVMPMSYVGTGSRALVTANPPNEWVPRAFYTVDKARSLSMMITMVKEKMIRFPKYETWATETGDANDYAGDFTALATEKRRVPARSDVFLVVCKENCSDDLTHAINFGALAYWHSIQAYPDIAKRVRTQLTSAQMDKIDPAALRRLRLGLPEKDGDEE